MGNHLSWPYAAAPHPQPYWGAQTSAVKYVLDVFLGTPARR